MINFVALSFTAFAREFAQGRKALTDIDSGFFVFNCHEDHLFSGPIDPKAQFGEDKACSELIDMMRRFMQLTEGDLIDLVELARMRLQQAAIESRLYCLKGMPVYDPRTTKRLLILGGLATHGRLPSQSSYPWMEGEIGFEGYLIRNGIEVIR